jgi:hypothetical protein
MKLHQFFGLEIDLISEYELLEAIEASGQLPLPEEQSIFAVKSPQDWIRAGQEVRRAFREETAQRLSELGSAFLLHVLQEFGEGFSDLTVETEQSDELEAFWHGEWLLELWQEMGARGPSGSFRQVEGCEPFTYVYLPHEQLIQIDFPDWELTLENWQRQRDEELPEWPARWLAELIGTLEEAQLTAAEQGGTPGLFIYPMIFPEMVYEVEEDEEPQLTVRRALDWLDQVERGQHPGEAIDPYLQYQLLRYLELKMQRLRQGMEQTDQAALRARFEGDPRSQAFAESYAWPDFLGEPKELILTLWALMQR